MADAPTRWTERLHEERRQVARGHPAGGRGHRSMSMLPSALLAILGLGPHPAWPVQERSDVPRILERVLTRQSAAPEEDVARLAELRTEEALAALEEVVDSRLPRPVTKAALRAMARFAGVEGLEREAIEFVLETSRSRFESMRFDATYALLGFGAAADAELEQIVRGGKDETCRAYALRGILPRLQERPTPEGLELILTHARLGKTLYRHNLVPVFRAFDDPAMMRTFARGLADHRMPPDVKTTVLEALADSDSAGVEEAFGEGLQSRYPMVQFAALLAMERRDPGEHVVQLQRLTRAEDRSVQREALLLLARNRLPEEEPLLPADLARQRDPVRRQVAAACLSAESDQVALELLHELVRDEDRAVRAEARMALVELHRRESVPVLIEALGSEEGLARKRTLEALRLLTGLDQGSAQERWQQWWAHDGARFEPPTQAEARALERERTERREENPTQASFYGLQIDSLRVCFVVDLSGSMRLRARGGRRRIDVALDELAAAIEALPDGALINVIFFEDDVLRWKRSPVELTPSTREQAVQFVRKREADGGTSLYDALEKAFEDTRIDTVYLLTDGEPSGGLTTSDYQLRREVERWNRSLHGVVHAVSVGADSALLRGISEDTGGTYMRAD